jgi:hypothetical protein
MLPDAQQVPKLMFKTMAASLVCLLLLGLASPTVRAAASCTDWIHLQAGPRDLDFYNERNRNSCVRDVESQSSRGGYKSQITLDTLFFWFGDDVVTARCLSRTLVVLSSYDYRSQDACPLLNQIKNTLRYQ